MIPLPLHWMEQANSVNSSYGENGVDFSLRVCVFELPITMRWSFFKPSYTYL